jgi:hypothetical protein
MAEYSRLAKGSFTTPASIVNVNVKLPFIPDTVKWWNYTARGTPTDTYIAGGYWDISMGQGFATVDKFATANLTTANVTTNGISTLSAGLLLQYGAQKQIVSATAANPAVFTVTGHGYGVGDVVVFQGLYQTPTTGMPQMAGIPFVITAVTTNTFTVQWDASGSNYTALSASPTGAFVKKVLYPSLYLPNVSFISAITTGTSTTIKTTNPHHMKVGQEVGFHIPASWGTIQLNELPNNLIPASPVYGYIVSVTDFQTVVVNINSTGFTAFNPNQTVASVPGLSFPQMVAVGDVNTGGDPISVGSQLYPPPTFLSATGSGSFTTINGPAIQGAFVNNTFQGFIFGTNLLVAAQTSSVIYYEATLHDYVNP